MSPTHPITTTMFALGLLGLTLNRNHLVSALLCLEAAALALFLSLTLIALTDQLATYMLHPITLLTLSACEAGTGLALLVASSRAYASDHLKNLSLLKC